MAWAVFFLVPVGRGSSAPRLTGEQVEDVFRRLWAQARVRPFPIKTTEAQHYRRFVAQHRREGPRDCSWGWGTRGRLNDGKGVVFVGHLGDIQPSGFLPIVCGRFPRESVVEVYQNHPVFRALRDADRLGGKCGRCEFRQICGGSRARAYAVTGDMLAEEPDCVYIPRSMVTSEEG